MCTRSVQPSTDALNSSYGISTTVYTRLKLPPLRRSTKPSNSHPRPISPSYAHYTPLAAFRSLAHESPRSGLLEPIFQTDNTRRRRSIPVQERAPTALLSHTQPDHIISQTSSKYRVANAGHGCEHYASRDLDEAGRGRIAGVYRRGIVQEIKDTNSRKVSATTWVRKLGVDMALRAGKSVEI
ncbi:hypothetical protein CC78DRAFT_528930 [Lojkania enalia]|uniref:Uncharacterized protein n=1 Tax=Lojkania enalia TaxID=147567 RepID=A0A9P4NAQ8_9PLEO|nr:hypothetical protein CC78DRAFT_528930 [Didymosphaeria enalia]